MCIQAKLLRKNGGTRKLLLHHTVLDSALYSRLPLEILHCSISKYRIIPCQILRCILRDSFLTA